MIEIDPHIVKKMATLVTAINQKISLEVRYRKMSGCHPEIERQIHTKNEVIDDLGCELEEWSLTFEHSLIRQQCYSHSS